MIFIASHARFDENGDPRYGTGSAIPEFLEDNKKDHLFIRHSLYGNSRTQIELFKDQQRNTKFVGISGLPFLLRIIQEQIINFWYMFIQREKISYFIGIDPLNAMSAVVGKKFKMVKNAIFYTADYAYKRFSNPLINKIYHKIDYFSAKNADQVWSVSTRIIKVRKKQGINEDKLHFVPNTPDFDKIKRKSLSRVNRQHLVVVGNITKSINYPLIIQGIKKLSKKYPDIKLKIIGSGEYIPELQELVSKEGVEGNVKFLGTQPHDKVLDILSESGIGIALYTKEREFNQFGDSMKAREYMACGLPVIINNVPSTADDIKKKDVGFVLEGAGENFAKLVDKLLSDDSLYKTKRKNAISYAKSTDIKAVLNDLLKV